MFRAVVIVVIVLLGAGAVAYWRFNQPLTDAEACRRGKEFFCDQLDAARQLSWVSTADPEADARSAIERGTPPILGLYGYASYTPGVDHPLPETCVVRMIDGSSDHASQEVRLLIRQAEQYAQTYNRIVLPHTNCAPEPVSQP